MKRISYYYWSRWQIALYFIVLIITSSVIVRGQGLIKVIAGIVILVLIFLGMAMLDALTVNPEVRTFRNRALRAISRFEKQLSSLSHLAEGCTEEDIANIKSQTDYGEVTEWYLSFMRRFGRGIKGQDTIFRYKYDDLASIMARGMEIGEQTGYPEFEESRFVFAELSTNGDSIFLFLDIVSPRYEDFTKEERWHYNLDPPIFAFSRNRQPTCVRDHASEFFSKVDT